MAEELKNFGGKINAELKDKIDEQLRYSNLPMGRIVEALAEFWVRLSIDEQRHLCYGTSNFEFGKFIDSRIQALLSFKTQIEPGLPRLQLNKAIGRIKEMIEVEKQQPGTIYRVLSKDEQKVLDEFYKLMSSEQKKHSKSA